MKYVLKTEELLMFLLGIYLFFLTKFPWWWFPTLIFLPDISMIGYIFNSKIGALLYNIFHHKGVAIILYLSGIYLKLDWIELTGIILFSHASMDRFLGYGLKCNKGFSYTHLGIIGKEKSKN